MPIKCHNRVLLLLACVAIVAVALPFVNVAPNRLVSGEPRALWQIWSFTPLLLGAALASTVALAFWPGRTALWLTFLLSEALFIVLFWSAGQAATQMAAVESPLARTSVGSGLWLWLALCLLVCSDAIRRLTPQPVLALAAERAILGYPSADPLQRRSESALAVKRVRQPPGGI